MKHLETHRLQSSGTMTLTVSWSGAPSVLFKISHHCVASTTICLGCMSFTGSLRRKPYAQYIEMRQFFFLKTRRRRRRRRRRRMIIHFAIMEIRSLLWSSRLIDGGIRDGDLRWDWFIWSSHFEPKYLKVYSTALNFMVQLGPVKGLQPAGREFYWSVSGLHHSQCFLIVLLPRLKERTASNIPHKSNMLAPRGKHSGNSRNN